MFGPEPYAAAKMPEGEITELHVAKAEFRQKHRLRRTFVTQAGDLGCGVGYYNKQREPTYCPEHGEAVVRPGRAGAAFTWGKSRAGAQ